MNFKKIPDLMLEQYILNELKDSDRKIIEDQLSHDLQLHERLEAIKQSNKEFALIHSDDCFLSKLPEANCYKNHTLYNLVPVPLLCTLLILPILLTLVFKTQTLNISERTKGELPLLIVYRKTQLGHEQLLDGVIVRPSDLLQVEYAVSDSQLSGMIISIDGAGNTTIHLGSDDGKSMQLSPINKRLPFSYELDNAPEYEKFYLITSQKPFQLKDCISLCKKMNKSFYNSKKFTIKMLMFNKVTLQEGS